MPPQAETAHLGAAQHPAVQRGTAVRAHLRGGAAGGAVRARQARGAGVRTGLDAAEAGGKRGIQALQHVLHDLCVEVAVLWADLLEGRQVC